MHAADVMNKQIVAVRPDDTILHAIRLMLQHSISGLPVTDPDGNLVGIITEGDLLRRTETKTLKRRSWWQTFLEGPSRLADEYAHCHGRRVKDVMTTQVVTVDENTPLAKIVELLEQHEIKRVPVMRDSRIVGIVSRANLVRALASVSRQVKMDGAADWAIRDQILTALVSEPWAPAAGVDVTVHRGVVDLWGMVLDEAQRDGVTVLVKNVPGVKAVNNHLRLFDPMSGVLIDAPAEYRGDPCPS